MYRNLCGSKRLSGWIAAAGVAAITAAAAGQTCWVYRPGVPDFDQTRIGLGNDGKNHCVPTSWTNWFAFFQDNGYAGLMGMPGNPVDWQTYSHGYVTTRINALGNALGTNPYKGTNATETQHLNYINSQLWEPAYILRWADGLWPEKDDTIGPKPKLAAAMLKMGAAVNMSIGWTVPLGSSPSATVFKEGSHVVSVNGVYGLCSPQTTLRYRDPGSSNGILNSQGDFTSEMSSTTPWFGMMRFNSDPTLRPTSAYIMDAYGDRRAFLFGLRCMMLNFGIGIDTQSGGLVIHRPQSMLRVAIPQTERVDFPGNAAVVDFDFLPNMAEGVAVVGGPSPAIWKLDLAFGEHVKLADLDNAGPVTTSRFGDIYVADGSKIRRFDPSTEREVGFVAPGVDVMALAYDDSLDEVVGVGIARGELVQLSHTLDNVRIRPLPAGTPTSSILSIDIHPVTRALWLAAGDGSVREISRPNTGALAVTDLKTLPGLSRAERLRFLPDGGVLVNDGSAPAEFQIDPLSGRFVRGNRSGLASGPIDSLLTTGRSRDDTPLGREPETDPEELPPGPTPGAIRDCVADIDASGEVDFGDFLAFFGCFDTLGECANLDFNTEVDFGDFLTFFGAYDAGC